MLGTLGAIGALAAPARADAPVVVLIDRASSGPRADLFADVVGAVEGDDRVEVRQADFARGWIPRIDPESRVVVIGAPLDRVQWFIDALGAPGAARRIDADPDRAAEQVCAAVRPQHTG